MEPLAPIVDRMREVARDELPSPRTCRIYLWDDGTFDVVVYHSMGDAETQVVRYVRQTSEILWERRNGNGWDVTTFADGESIHEPAVDELDARVIATVDPPYQ